MDEETIDRLYFPAFQAALNYGSEDAQEVALYALRALGWEAWGNGYNEDFYWEIKKPGSEFWCRIDPQIKPGRNPMSLEYPTDDEMIEALRTSVPPPVMDIILAEAKESERPVRKVVGDFIMEAAAIRIVREKFPGK